VLTRGNRLYQEYLRFQKETAAQVHEYRNRDITFRVFRHDALQKYRAQFDLAAMYVYLAAKAYDYETNLLGTDTRSGQRFLTDIVRERVLGSMSDGKPQLGSGLANVLFRMHENFALLKGPLGFYTPTERPTRFSLREELFRISMASAKNWRDVLEKHRVADLWAIPEFRRYCRPFTEENKVPQPGLVIPFSTTITEGPNYFGWPAVGRDSTYDSSHFTTKVHSVGVWFSGYPADQVFPAPFSLSDSDLTDNAWIPIVDTLGAEIATIRRFSRLLASHPSSNFDASETTSNSRLIGRSVWNTRWLLIIPGLTLHNNPNEGLDTFIHGLHMSSGTGERDGNGVTDIQISFRTYAYSGN
jgi:hypothetical protein